MTWHAILNNNSPKKLTH